MTKYVKLVFHQENKPPNKKKNHHWLYTPSFLASFPAIVSIFSQKNLKKLKKKPCNFMQLCLLNKQLFLFLFFSLISSSYPITSPKGAVQLLIHHPKSKTKLALQCRMFCTGLTSTGLEYRAALPMLLTKNEQQNHISLFF